MADEYVYFYSIRDTPTGEVVQSERRASLAAISTRGEPIMESQLVVDSSELDTSGFLVSRSVGGSHPTDEIWGEIRSLNLRAATREREAAMLDGSIHGERKYLLSVESRVLRSQALRLQRERTELLVKREKDAGDCVDFVSAT